MRLLVKALCARRKFLLKSSVQEMSSCDERPAIAVSKGASTEEQWGTTRERTLYTPIKDFMSLTFLGMTHEERVKMRWGLILELFLRPNPAA